MSLILGRERRPRVVGGLAAGAGGVVGGLAGAPHAAWNMFAGLF